MSDELKTMEDRLMARITGLQEQMLERFHAVDHRLDSIGTTLKAMNTTLELMTSLLTDFAGRITDLEKK